MDFDASHASSLPGREDLNFVFLTYRTGNQRSGNDRATAPHNEDAIDRETEEGARILAAHFTPDTHQLSYQMVEAISGLGTYGHDGSPVHKRAPQVLLDFQTHDVQGLRIDEVRFREDGNAAGNIQQADDIKVFAGLRLDALVGGDDQQHDIDAAGSGKHVAHEALVTGDVDEAEPKDVTVVSRKIQVGKADVNGDAA